MCIRDRKEAEDQQEPEPTTAAEVPAAETADAEAAPTPTAPPVLPEPSLHSDSGLPLIALRSPSVTEWTSEDMTLDWNEAQTVYQLRRLRDFLVEGMMVNVVEEKV